MRRHTKPACLFGCTIIAQLCKARHYLSFFFCFASEFHFHFLHCSHLLQHTWRVSLNTTARLYTLHIIICTTLWCGSHFVSYSGDIVFWALPWLFFFLMAALQSTVYNCHFLCSGSSVWTPVRPPWTMLPSTPHLYSCGFALVSEINRELSSRKSLKQHLKLLPWKCCPKMKTFMHKTWLTSAVKESPTISRIKVWGTANVKLELARKNIERQHLPSHSWRAKEISLKAECHNPEKYSLILCLGWKSQRRWV